MTDLQALGERLAQLRRERSARERRDVTADEIAAAIGVTGAAYSRYEKGLRRPKDRVVDALAVYHGVSRGFIRYGEETTTLVTDEMADHLSPISGTLTAKEKLEAAPPVDLGKKPPRRTG